jgi:lysine 6-dehydrogenase
MKNFAVLGLGLMGKAICYDLLAFTNEPSIFGFEINESRRNQIEKEFSNFGPRFVPKQLNLIISNEPQEDILVKEFKLLNVKVVFGAIDYKFNEYLTKICIEAGCSFVDLGGNPDIVNKQHLLHEKAKEANITVIPDLGLAPGMANIIAASVMSDFSTLDECHIRVGGLPQNPKTILKYQQVFSIRGLTNEYLEDAIVIRDGKLTKVPSLTEIEEIHFPELLGKFEAFQTAGGTSNLPKIFNSKIKELTYKTIRYAGHAQFIQFLKDFELLSSEKYLNSNFTPREVIEHYLVKHLPKGEPDIVLVRVIVSGTIGNEKKEVVTDLMDFADENYSSMARTTAFPTSIIGQMIMNNIIQTKGVLFGEVIVPKDIFLFELSKRNIKFNKRVINT